MAPLICRVVTIQRTDFTSTWEELLNNEVRYSRVSIEQLDSDPTRSGNVDKYTHRFQVKLILSSEVCSPNEYICQKLTKESFLYERSKRRIILNYPKRVNSSPTQIVAALK